MNRKNVLVLVGILLAIFLMLHYSGGSHGYWHIKGGANPELLDPDDGAYTTYNNLISPGEYLYKVELINNKNETTEAYIRSNSIPTNESNSFYHDLDNTGVYIKVNSFYHKYIWWFHRD